MIGIDTSAIIDLFKSEKPLINLLKDIDNKLVSTIINYQEIMFGLDLSNIKHEIEKDYYESLFEDIKLVFLTKQASQRASEILGNLKKKGKMIDDFDCMIAGILLSNGVDKIITKNAKHFENIKGLKVISY